MLRAPPIALVMMEPWYHTTKLQMDGPYTLMEVMQGVVMANIPEPFAMASHHVKCRRHKGRQAMIKRPANIQQSLSTMAISFAVLILGACSEDPVKPKNVNAYFDHVDATQTDISVVQLDNYRREEIIELTPENVLGYHPDGPESSSFSGMNSMKVSGDSVYISSLVAEDVFILNPGKNNYRKLGRKGVGPGEYQTVFAILAVDEYIYFLTQDARLIKHDKSLNVLEENNLKYIRSIPMGEPYAISDSLLFAPLPEGQDKIIASLNTNSGEIIDSLVQPLKIDHYNLPKAHNNSLNVSNYKDGRIIFTFPAMGVSKIYDQGVLEQVIEFNAGWFDSQESPDLDMPELNQEEFITLFIQNMYILNNRDLLVSTYDANLYYLKHTGESYEVETKFRFKRLEHLQRDFDDDRFIRPSILSVGKNHVYFTSEREDYPYRIPLDKVISSME